MRSIRDLANAEALDTAKGAGSYTEKGVVRFAADGTIDTYDMKPNDRLVIATSDQSDGVCIIYLPPMSQAIGKFYGVLAPTGAAAGDVSVYDRDGATHSEIGSGGDLDADADFSLFYCDGTTWRVIFTTV